MKSSINMFKALFEVNTAKVSKSFFNIVSIIIIAVLAGANFAGYMFFKSQTNMYNEQKTVSEAFINNPQNMEKQAEYLAFEDGMDAISQYLTDTAQLEEFVSVQPKFNTAFYGKLKDIKPIEIDITDLSLSNGALTISCECASDDNGPPARYAQALDESGLFSAITYSGFSFNGTRYTFSVSCVF